MHRTMPYMMLYDKKNLAISTYNEKKKEEKNSSEFKFRYILFDYTQFGLFISIYGHFLILHHPHS